MRRLKFAECMRDNGVSEFPDPDASGNEGDPMKRRPARPLSAFVGRLHAGESGRP